MRKTILLGLLFAHTHLFAGGGIKFDMRNGKPGYEILKIRGVEVWKAPELSDLSEKNKQSVIKFMDRVLYETDKYMPHTLKSFKEKGYKVMLFQENSPGNGLEFLRKNQHTWDDRIDKRGTMDKSIIFVKTTEYVNLGSQKALFFFMHEMAHFRHLAISRDHNPQILAAYKSARAGGKYFGSYAGKNHLEYFADISASFLLPRNRGHKYPRGARELRDYDPKGYKLLCTIWGGEPMPPADLRQVARKFPFPSALATGPLAQRSDPPQSSEKKPEYFFPQQAEKPRNPILIRRENPVHSGRYTTAYDDSPTARKEYRLIYDTIEDAKFNAHLKRRDRAIQKYREAYTRLNTFILKYPNWNGNLAEKKAAKLTEEIQAFGNSSD